VGQVEQGILVQELQQLRPLEPLQLEKTQVELVVRDIWQ
jgi:hypothetical protein